jgi:hypothetical protein
MCVYNIIPIYLQVYWCCHNVSLRQIQFWRILQVSLVNTGGIKPSLALKATNQSAVTFNWFPFLRIPFHNSKFNLYVHVMESMCLVYGTYGLNWYVAFNKLLLYTEFTEFFWTLSIVLYTVCTTYTIVRILSSLLLYSLGQQVSISSIAEFDYFFIIKAFIYLFIYFLIYLYSLQHTYFST